MPQKQIKTITLLSCLFLYRVFLHANIFIYLLILNFIINRLTLYKSLMKQSVWGSSFQHLFMDKIQDSCIGNSQSSLKIQIPKTYPLLIEINSNTSTLQIRKWRVKEIDCLKSYNYYLTSKSVNKYLCLTMPVLDIFSMTFVAAFSVFLIIYLSIMRTMQLNSAYYLEIAQIYYKVILFL